MSTKNHTLRNGLAAVIILLALVIGAAALSAAVLMIGLALVHREVPAVPALSLFGSFGAELILGSLALAFKSNASVK